MLINFRIVALELGEYSPDRPGCYTFESDAKSFKGVLKEIWLNDTFPKLIKFFIADRKNFIFNNFQKVIPFWTNYFE